LTPLIERQKLIEFESVTFYESSSKKVNFKSCFKFALK
jgi:hypothetical protein